MEKGFKAIFVIALVLIVSNTSFAAETCPKDPLTHHIVEALEMNKVRSKLYKKDVGKEAYRAVKRLMFYERLMIPFTKLMNFRGRKLRKSGVPIFCDDVIPMANTAPYTSRVVIEKDEVGEVPSVKQMKKIVRQAYDRGSFQAAHVELINLIHEYEEKRPHSMCLTRHFLESIARGAMIAQKNIKESDPKLRKKIKKLSWSYLKLQLFGLSSMNHLDKRARKLNLSGIPVYCNDVPPIPYQ